MELIDTHTHLYLEDFEGDRSQTVTDAISGGIIKMLLPNIDRDTVEPMLSLCHHFPGHCYPMTGLHPTSVKDDYKEHLNELISLMANHHFLAIGETGIDLYWDKTFIKEQCEAFREQVELAASCELPLVIHCRESFSEIIKILEKSNHSSFKGVFHSFTGTYEQACLVLDMGFHIGLNGIITYKKSHLPEIIPQLPLERIVLETDSPYLTPVPFRGKRNQSLYLIYIAQKIAGIRNLPPDVVADITTQNAMRLFNL